MAESEVRRMVALPRSVVEKFEAAYGEGRLSWGLSLLLDEFMKCHTLHPDDYAAIAAHALRNKIEDC